MQWYLEQCFVPTPFAHSRLGQGFRRAAASPAKCVDIEVGFGSHARCCGYTYTGIDEPAWLHACETLKNKTLVHRGQLEQGYQRTQVLIK